MSPVDGLPEARAEPLLAHVGVVVDGAQPLQHARQGHALVDHQRDQAGQLGAWGQGAAPSDTDTDRGRHRDR